MTNEITIPGFSKVKILVIGDIMLDQYVWGRVDRISPEAPVPILIAERETASLGGAGNVAANLAGLGCETCLIGYVANDFAGTTISDLATKAGITTRFMLPDVNNTTVKTRYVADGHHLLRVDVDCSCNGKSRDLLSFSEATYQSITKLFFDEMEKNSKPDAVILSDYNKGVFWNGACQVIIKGCRHDGIPVFVDPKAYDWLRYSGSTCITPNVKELSEAIHHPLSIGIDVMLLTCGAEGVELYRGNYDSCIKIPSEAKEVYDVSGAGDTVIATLAACIASGMDWEDSARLANRAAGIVVGRTGTSPISISDLITPN